MWRYYSTKLGSLPDPAVDAHPWHNLMLNFRRQWGELVSGYTFYGSPTGDHSKTTEANVLARWRCQLGGAKNNWPLRAWVRYDEATGAMG